MKLLKFDVTDNTLQVFVDDDVFAWISPVIRPDEENELLTKICLAIGMSLREKTDEFHGKIIRQRIYKVIAIGNNTYKVLFGNKAEQNIYYASLDNPELKDSPVSVSQYEDQASSSFEEVFVADTNRIKETQNVQGLMQELYKTAEGNFQSGIVVLPEESPIPTFEDIMRESTSRNLFGSLEIQRYKDSVEKQVEARKKELQNTQAKIDKEVKKRRDKITKFRGYLTQIEDQRKIGVLERLDGALELLTTAENIISQTNELKKLDEINEIFFETLERKEVEYCTQFSALILFKRLVIRALYESAREYYTLHLLKNASPEEQRNFNRYFNQVAQVSSVGQLSSIDEAYDNLGQLSLGDLQNKVEAILTDCNAGYYISTSPAAESVYKHLENLSLLCKKRGLCIENKTPLFNFTSVTRTAGFQWSEEVFQFEKVTNRQLDALAASIPILKDKTCENVNQAKRAKGDKLYDMTADRAFAQLQQVDLILEQTKGAYFYQKAAQLLEKLSALSRELQISIRRIESTYVATHPSIKKLIANLANPIASVDERIAGIAKNISHAERGLVPCGDSDKLAKMNSISVDLYKEVKKHASTLSLFKDSLAYIDRIFKTVPVVESIAKMYQEVNEEVLLDDSDYQDNEAKRISDFKRAMGAIDKESKENLADLLALEKQLEEKMSARRLTSLDVSIKSAIESKLKRAEELEVMMRNHQQVLRLLVPVYLKKHAVTKFLLRAQKENERNSSILADLPLHLKREAVSASAIAQQKNAELQKHLHKLLALSQQVEQTDQQEAVRRQDKLIARLINAAENANAYAEKAIAEAQQNRAKEEKESLQHRSAKTKSNSAPQGPSIFKFTGLSSSPKLPSSSQESRKVSSDEGKEKEGDNVISNDAFGASGGANVSGASEGIPPHDEESVSISSSEDARRLIKASEGIVAILKNLQHWNQYLTCKRLGAGVEATVNDETLRVPKGIAEMIAKIDEQSKGSESYMDNNEHARNLLNILKDNALAAKERENNWRYRWFGIRNLEVSMLYYQLGALNIEALDQGDFSVDTFLSNFKKSCGFTDENLATHKL